MIRVKIPISELADVKSKVLVAVTIWYKEKYYLIESSHGQK
jgi:hypothetical protein